MNNSTVTFSVDRHTLQALQRLNLSVKRLLPTAAVASEEDRDSCKVKMIQASDQPRCIQSIMYSTVTQLPSPLTEALEGQACGCGRHRRDAAVCDTDQRQRTDQQLRPRVPAVQRCRQTQNASSCAGVAEVSQGEVRCLDILEWRRRVRGSGDKIHRRARRVDREREGFVARE